MSQSCLKAVKPPLRRTRKRRRVVQSSDDEDSLAEHEPFNKSFLDLAAVQDGDSDSRVYSDDEKENSSDRAFIACSDEGDEGDEGDSDCATAVLTPPSVIAVTDPLLRRLMQMPNDVISNVHTFIYDASRVMTYNRMACYMCHIARSVFTCGQGYTHVHYQRAVYGNSDYSIERYCCSLRCLYLSSESVINNKTH